MLLKIKKHFKGLADALNANSKFDVWYDDYSLRRGDTLLGKHY
jgi:hypothetical protein